MMQYGKDNDGGGKVDQNPSVHAAKEQNNKTAAANSIR